MADSHEMNTLCPVCQETFGLKEHYPKLLPCDHTICKSCIRQLGSDFDCPVCRFHIESTDLLAISTNFLAINVTLGDDTSSTKQCEEDGSSTDYYDSELTPTAETCTFSEGIGSVEHAEETSFNADQEDKLELKFTEAFDETSEKIACYDHCIEHLKRSKECTLEQIDNDFEQLLQLLLRRKQLLKNQVLTHYEEKLEEIEENMEKVTFSTMCLNSLQKHSVAIFDEHAQMREELPDEKLDAQNSHCGDEEICAKLSGNCAKISFEIEELLEKLEDKSDIKEMEFSYESHSQADIGKCIKTFGRIKLNTCQ